MPVLPSSFVLRNGFFNLDVVALRALQMVISIESSKVVATGFLVEEGPVSCYKRFKQ